MPLTERFEFLAISRRAVPEVFKCLLQQRTLPRDHRAEINDIIGKLRLTREIQCIEITALHQAIDTDQQRVAGERRKALVRRIAVTGRPERQDLPDVLSRVAQEVGEGMRLLTELADTIGAGKGSGVQQDTAGSREVHA